MNVIDIILGVVLLLGFVRGFQKGFIIELAGIVALLAGIFIGLEHGHVVEVYVTKWTDWSASTVEIASFFVVFIAVLIVVSLIAQVLTTLLHSIALGLFNRIFGAVFGVIKTGLFILILLLIFEYVNTNGRFVAQEKIEESVVVSLLQEFNATFLPSFKELLEESEILNGGDSE
jgi:membrane protein required for colicin V production